MNNSEDRPEFVTDEHLEYLDELRESGATNMYGAWRFLRDVFTDLLPEQAHAVLSYWMNTFSDRHPKE